MTNITGTSGKEFCGPCDPQFLTLFVICKGKRERPKKRRKIFRATYFLRYVAHLCTY